MLHTREPLSLARSIRDAVYVVTVPAVLETDLTGAEEKLRKMRALGQNLNQFLEAVCGMQQEAARAPLHCPSDPRGLKIPAQAVIHCPNNPSRHTFPAQAIIRARPKTY